MRASAELSFFVGLASCWVDGRLSFGDPDDPAAVDAPRAVDLVCACHSADSKISRIFASAQSKRTARSCSNQQF